MGAAEHREPNDVDVFLNRGGRDHLRCLMEASVDDLHTGVAQRSRNDLRAAVVAIETRFGDQHADWTH